MDPKDVVRLHFEALSSGDIELTRRVVAADHVNHMAADEPPACALPGPPGFVATSAWLRFAFLDLVWEEISYVAEGDWVVAHMRMTGVHAGPFVVFPPGQPAEVFPPTDRRIEVRQAHFFRLRDAQSTQHIAVRDDLRMMVQLGFIPPSPRVGLRLATWRLFGRNAAAVKEATERAATEAARATGNAASSKLATVRREH